MKQINKTETKIKRQIIFEKSLTQKELIKVLEVLPLSKYFDCNIPRDICTFIGLEVEVEISIYDLDILSQYFDVEVQKHFIFIKEI